MAVRDITIIPQSINNLTQNNLTNILGYPCEVIECRTQRKITGNEVMNSSNGYDIYNDIVMFHLSLFVEDEQNGPINKDMFDIIPENNIDVQQLLINWKQCDYKKYFLMPWERPKNHPENLHLLANPDFVKITVAICTLLEGIIEFAECFDVGEKPGLYTANQWQALMTILQETRQR